MIAYRTLTEVYQFEDNQFVFQEKLPFTVKAVTSRPEDLLLFTDTAVISYAKRVSLLDFPAPIQHVQFANDLFFVSCRNQLMVYSMDFSLVCSHAMVFDISSIAVHATEGSSIDRVLRVERVIVAVSEWISNKLTMFLLSQQQLTAVFSEDYTMGIKSMVFTLVEQASLFYCLLNHIDGGIRILKHSAEQWTEDKYVTLFPCCNVVPHDCSSWRMGFFTD